MTCMRGTGLGAEDAVCEHVIIAIKIAQVRCAEALLNEMLTKIIIQTFLFQSSGLKTAISAKPMFCVWGLTSVTTNLSHVTFLGGKVISLAAVASSGN
jgi:hypothetical protein